MLSSSAIAFSAAQEMVLTVCPTPHARAINVEITIGTFHFCTNNSRIYASGSQRLSRATLMRYKSKEEAANIVAAFSGLHFSSHRFLSIVLQYAHFDHLSYFFGICRRCLGDPS